jgi:hypothetical protein
LVSGITDRDRGKTLLWCLDVSACIDFVVPNGPGTFRIMKWSDFIYVSVLLPFSETRSNPRFSL